jgi:hypothetical protein
MAIGNKAAFWRQYIEQHLHERIQYRSLIDAMLRDFAHTEAAYVELREEWGMRVTYCETWCDKRRWWQRWGDAFRQRWTTLRRR